MTRAEELNRAILYLANQPIKTPETRNVIDKCILKLSKGTPVEVMAAEELQALIDYHKSEESNRSAFYLQKALLTSEGRKEAGIPPKTKGKTYRPEDVKQTDLIMQKLVMRELGDASSEDVENALMSELGFGCDARTKAKFVKELMPRVKSYAYWGKLARDYRAYVQSNKDSPCK
jgi:hypothetical protein